MEQCNVSPNNSTLHMDFHIFHSCWVGVILIWFFTLLLYCQTITTPSSVWKDLISVSLLRGQGDGDKVSYCIFDYWALTIFSQQQITAAMWKTPRRFSLTVSIRCALHLCSYWEVAGLCNSMLSSLKLYITYFECQCALQVACVVRFTGNWASDRSWCSFQG